MIFDFLETSGSSRSVRCQSFSSVRRLEAEKTPKNQNEKNWIFGQVRFGRFDNPFDLIDNVPMGDGGPPWSTISNILAPEKKSQQNCRIEKSVFRQFGEVLEDLWLNGRQNQLPRQILLQINLF